MLKKDLPIFGLHAVRDALVNQKRKNSINDHS